MTKLIIISVIMLIITGCVKPVDFSPEKVSGVIILEPLSDCGKWRKTKCYEQRTKIITDIRVYTLAKVIMVQKSDMVYVRAYARLLQLCPKDYPNSCADILEISNR